MHIDHEPGTHRAKKILSFALPMVVIWSIYLLTFWPGVMSPDSINQWGQVLTGQFNDLHPVFDTFSIWILTRIWLSPAIVAVFQLVSLALITGWGLYEMNQWGVPTLVCLGVAFVFAFSPVNGTMVITLWKDIPYSIALLVLTICFIKIIFSNGKWMENRNHSVFTGMVCVLIAGYRHNGILVVIPSLLVLLVIYRARWRNIALSLMVFFAGWVLVTDGLDQLLKVEKHPEFTNVLFLHHIAAHVTSGTSLNSAETSYLNSLYPLPDWPYSCCTVNDTYFDSKFNQTIFSQDTKKPQKIFLELLARNPLVNLKHVICSSSMVWQVGAQCNLSTVWMNRDGGRITWVEPNAYGIVENSRIPALAPLLYRALEKIEANRALFNLVWSAAVYLYFLVMVVIISAVRLKSWKMLLLATPALLQSVTLAMVNLSQNFRYQYPVYLMGLFFITLLFVPVHRTAVVKDQLE